jgi:high-affinity nickel permease
MKKVAQAVSFVALGGVVLFPVLFAAGTLSLGAMKGALLAVTAVWFASAPLWMGREG